MYHMSSMLLLTLAYITLVYVDYDYVIYALHMLSVYLNVICYIYT